jgi:hypothetical protein
MPLGCSTFAFSFSEFSSNLSLVFLRTFILREGWLAAVLVSGRCDLVIPLVYLFTGLFACGNYLEVPLKFPHLTVPKFLRGRINKRLVVPVPER